MKKRSLAALAILLLLAVAPALAQEAEKEAEDAATATALATHVMIDPADIVWQPAPEVLPVGAQIAVLSGDPSKEGPFVIRIKAPDGYEVAPHWHPAVETVTVISGTFGFGLGDIFDAATGTELGPGGLFVMQPEVEHFAWTKGETVVQVSAHGPWQLNYVNPADDPRNAAPEEGVPSGR